MVRLLQNYFRLIPLALSFAFISSTSWAQQKPAPENNRKLYGEALITNNYVDKGITQSDKSWALQAGFGYRMGPQARLGLWGSSVKLPTNDESVNLRLYFDVKMEFTTNTDLILRYDFNRYFQSDVHNGSIFSLDFQSVGYHVLVEMNDNWEGTHTSTTWFGFRKEYSIPWNLVFTPTVGYSQVSAEGYKNYFDIRAPIGYRFAEVLYELGVTTTSESSQFAGRGATSAIFSIHAVF